MAGVCCYIYNPGMFGSEQANEKLIGMESEDRDRHRLSVWHGCNLIVVVDTSNTTGAVG